MIIHYVRIPWIYQTPPENPQLYPICGSGTWESAQSWYFAPEGSVITCFGCINRWHRTTWPSDYRLMYYNPPELTEAGRRALARNLP